MNLTQFLIFEITDRCNLGRLHHACPNTDPRRWPAGELPSPLTDDQIVAIATAAYQEFGFRGLVGWHYYCEPMLEIDRIRGLIGRIRSAVPNARFVLWTNGSLIRGQDLSMFEQLHVTRYEPGVNIPAPAAFPQFVRIYPGVLDQRREPKEAWSDEPCARPFTEMVFDYRGFVHACCYDWRGEVFAGLNAADSLGRIVGAWQGFRESVSGLRMAWYAPACCRSCPFRSQEVTRFDELLALEAEQAISHARARQQTEGGH